MINEPAMFRAFVVRMLESSPDEKEQFAARARAMPYSKFLETHYWQCVRGWMLHIEPRCQFCGTTHWLSVHHLTYDHLGEEWKNLDDLRVLCRDCHGFKHRLASVETISTIYKRRIGSAEFMGGLSPAEVKLTIDDIRRIVTGAGGGQ